MALYEVSTYHGTELLFDEKTGLICHGKSNSLDFLRLFAWVPASNPNACFLISSILTRSLLKLEMDYERADVISLRLCRIEDEMVVLRHPLFNSLICAEESSARYGRVIPNRSQVGPWEKFKFTLVSEPSQDILVKARKLDALIAATRTASATLHHLLSNTAGPCGSSQQLSSVVRLLQPHELEWLGRAIGRNEAACRAFAAAFEHDVWASQALPDLLKAGSETGSATTSERRIGPLTDHLALSGLTGKYVSVTQICNAFARRDRAPTRKLCLLATARNEGLYFLEWIAYHRALGVETFFIYTNDNEDGSDELLGALVRAGIINWIRNRVDPGVSPQYKAYGHAFQVLPDIVAYQWVGVIDLDEFVVLDTKRFSTIPEFIASIETQNTDAIALNWLMFGSHAQTRRTNEPVTRRFSTREPGVNPHVKSFCRPGRFIHSHCHYPIWDDYTAGTFRTADGSLHPRVRGDATALSSRPTDRGAWINHYYTKSAEEYILRRASSRGDVALAVAPSGAFFSNAAAGHFVGQHASDSMPSDRRAMDCVPALQAEIAVLRGLPGVDAAMVQVEACYHSRLARLAAVLGLDPRFQVPGSPERWFADVLGRSDMCRSL